MKVINIYRTLNVAPKSYQNEDERYKVRIERGGKPVTSIQSDRVTVVEEKVESLPIADHIKYWFVKNVQNGKDDYERRTLDGHTLRMLLEVCETVLDGSHLVRKETFKASDYEAVRRRMESSHESTKVIKNVAVAHKFLPMRAGYGTGDELYDEVYLKEVEVARDFAERMLIDFEKGLEGQLYYSISY